MQLLSLHLSLKKKQDLNDLSIMLHHEGSWTIFIVKEIISSTPQLLIFFFASFYHSLFFCFGKYIKLIIITFKEINKLLK